MKRWPRPKGRRRHIPGEMNKTEEAYSLVLEAQKRAGEIADYWFESLTLKIAPDCRYTPDFLVMMNDGALELHEVKAARRSKEGRITPLVEDDALVKVKAAADKFVFPIRLVYRYKSEPWLHREI